MKSIRPEGAPDIYYEVKVEEIDGVFPFADYFSCDLKQGDRVTLLYSEKLRKGVILPGGQTFFHIVYNWGYGVGFTVFYVIVWVGLVIWALFRIYSFVSVVYVLVRKQYLEQVPNLESWSARILGFSEFSMDFTFVVTSVCAIALIMFGLLKGVIYAENVNALVLGLVLFVVGVLLYSKVAEWFIKKMLYWRQRIPLWKITRKFFRKYGVYCFLLERYQLYDKKKIFNLMRVLKSCRLIS